MNTQQTNAQLLAAQVREARLSADPRVLTTGNRDLFMAAARNADNHKGPSLTILERPPEEKETLRSLYKKVRDFRTINAGVDLVSRAYFVEEELKLDIPEALIELGAEADLLVTAKLYAEATGINKTFMLRPSTVVDADMHTHHTSVLSISWGGTGLATDVGIKETAQLNEGDFGLLSPNMPHRSPYRSAPGRMVMFVAPPLYG